MFHIVHTIQWNLPPSNVDIIFQAAAAISRAKESEHQTWREKQASWVLMTAKDGNVMDQLQEARLAMDNALKEKNGRIWIQGEGRGRIQVQGASHEGAKVFLG